MTKIKRISDGRWIGNKKVFIVIVIEIATNEQKYLPVARQYTRILLRLYIVGYWK